MKTKYKYIYFEKLSAYNHYGCYNSKSDTPLGTIEYYLTWKQFCFIPAGDNFIFNSQCLLDIVDFLSQLNGGKK